jgi:hypothetical protein
MQCNTNAASVDYFSAAVQREHLNFENIFEPSSSDDVESACVQTPSLKLTTLIQIMRAPVVALEVTANAEQI